MMKGEKAFEIIGVQHLATRNSLTIHARIYVRNAEGKVFCFDADSTIWELTPLLINDCEDMHKILGVAQ